jgi:hypothetical protein
LFGILPGICTGGDKIRETNSQMKTTYIIGYPTV